MTPKEEARELVNKFYQPLGYFNHKENNDTLWEYGKQCALIAIGEIIKESNIYRVSYWNNVKTEINKL